MIHGRGGFIAGTLAVLLGVIGAPGFLGAKDSTATFGEVVVRGRELAIDRADSVLHTSENAQHLDIQVRAKVELDPVSRLYRYTYTVFNESSSDSCLDTFLLTPVREPFRMESPKGWSVDCCSWEGSTSAIVWSVIGRDDEPSPPGVLERGQVARSVVNTRPGESVRGFSLVSSAPPTDIRFYAEQFDSLPEGEGDEVATPSVFDYGVRGETIGPDTTSAAAHSRLTPSESKLNRVSRSTRPPGEARIYYSVTRAQGVRLEICDAKGRTIRIIRQGHVPVGLWGAIWDGLDKQGKVAPAGLYAWRLSSSQSRVEDRRPIQVP